MSTVVRRKMSGTPQVEVGAPCLRCGKGCQGLLLHVWRKICINCRCPREVHLVTFTPSRAPVKDSDEKDFNFYQYTWCPSGISLAMVKQYMNSLPSDHIPLKGTEGEKKRNELYLKQLPPHDQDPDMCHILSDKERKRLVKFSERIKQQACGVGIINVLHDRKDKVECVSCKVNIEQEAIYITIKHLGSLAWHPHCFTCSQCKDMLVDLIYFYNDQDDAVYCGRHYSDLKVPRCAGCDELIFAETLTQAEGQNWHKEHFSCDICDIPLQGRKYSSEGGVSCENCYNKHRAKQCSHCQRPIVLGATKIHSESGDLVFHDKCFVCSKCGEKMMDKKQFVLFDKILCGGCVGQRATPIAQCSACKESITPYSSYLQHESQSWHTECFHCISCRKSLIDQGFKEYDSNLMCVDCFANKVGKKCHVCYKAIIGKGIQYSFKMYHTSCFYCTMCKTSLIDTKPSDRNGELCCPVCLEKVATKCTACNKPITTKYTLYRKKPFHLSCFRCTQCGVAIGNQPYYETSLNDILCEPCAGDH